MGRGVSGGQAVDHGRRRPWDSDPSLALDESLEDTEYIVVERPSGRPAAELRLACGSSDRDRIGAVRHEITRGDSELDPEIRVREIRPVDYPLGRIVIDIH